MRGDTFTELAYTWYEKMTCQNESYMYKPIYKILLKGKMIKKRSDFLSICKCKESKNICFNFFDWISLDILYIMHIPVL